MKKFKYNYLCDSDREMLINKRLTVFLIIIVIVQIFAVGYVYFLM
jgi:hypothetical protein